MIWCFLPPSFPTPTVTVQRGQASMCLPWKPSRPRHRPVSNCLATGMFVRFGWSFFSLIAARRKDKSRNFDVDRTERKVAACLRRQTSARRRGNPEITRNLWRPWSCRSERMTMQRIRTRDHSGVHPSVGERHTKRSGEMTIGKPPCGDD